MPDSLTLLLGIAASVLLVCVQGCSFGIGVRRAPASPQLVCCEDRADEKDLSVRTVQTLRSLDLESNHPRQPDATLSRLHQIAMANPQPDMLFALAEISYIQGRHCEKTKTHAIACRHYYFCAGYAYHYLFGSSEWQMKKDPKLRSRPPSVFDPRFRKACELYNLGLAKCIRAAQHVGRLDPRRQLHLPTSDNTSFALSVSHHGFPWKPEEFGPLSFCADFQVVGLENQYRGYGLGVPMIALGRPRDQAQVKSKASRLSYFPHKVSFPVTAFFRFEGSLADLGTRRCGQLELFNPLRFQHVQVGHQRVPLETDLTTPLAYFLNNSDLDTGVKGFLQADKVASKSGVYMFEPYEKGKIPVVMVHGLLSSPLTWAPIFNDLQADPWIRKRFQFWFYLYPTGNPYLVAAADLRDSLRQLRRDVDPNNQDPALDQMTLVGHSMGGLVSKLLTVDSREDYWKLVSNRPFDAIKAMPQTRIDLARTFFFQPEPYVKRLVFLGTPHHGSKLSPSPLGKLAAKLVKMPKRLLLSSSDLSKENPDLTSDRWTIGKDHHLPTSVELLAPGAPALELLAGSPIPEGVRCHSIIGVLKGKGDNKGDGIVPYRSAHLGNADSELQIEANHFSIHHHPRAVAEVKRILREHWEKNGNIKSQAHRDQKSRASNVPVAFVSPRLVASQ